MRLKGEQTLSTALEEMSSSVSSPICRRRRSWRSIRAQTSLVTWSELVLQLYTLTVWRPSTHFCSSKHLTRNNKDKVDTKTKLRSLPSNKRATFVLAVDSETSSLYDLLWSPASLDECENQLRLGLNLSSRWQNPDVDAWQLWRVTAWHEVKCVCFTVM